MNFLIIIPVHNEEKLLPLCLKSLEWQTHKNLDIIIVNDGSTDNTEMVAQKFQSNTNLQHLSIKNLISSDYQVGSKVVNAFNEGLQYKKNNHYDKADIICKIDADIVFPKNYFFELHKMFEENAHLGMASGIVKINTKGTKHNNIFDFNDSQKDWEFENISSKNHIRGPIKAYRKKCLEEMNGLRPTLGWDNIDVMLAQKKGWKIKTKKDLWVKHLRPTGAKYRKQSAKKLGEYFYNIGLDLPLVVLSAFKSAWRNLSVTDFFVTINAFRQQKHERLLTEEEIQFIRDLRWKGIKQRFKW